MRRSLIFLLHGRKNLTLEFKIYMCKLYDRQRKHSESRRNFPVYIFLDVHGVLTDGNERKRFLAQMEERYGMEYKQHNSLWNAHLDRLDKGLEKASGYVSAINRTFHTHLSVNDYYGMFLKQIKVNKALMEKLDEIGVKVCIVSDNLLPISTGLNKILGQRFQKYRKFYSFQLGVTKMGGMLQSVLKRLETKPGKCLLIDDSKKNIEAGKEIGIHALLFKTNRELFFELEKLFPK